MTRVRSRRSLVALLCGALALVAACGDDAPAATSTTAVTIDSAGSTDSAGSIDVPEESSIDQTPVTTAPTASTVPTPTVTTSTVPAESDDPLVPRPPLLNADGGNEAYSGVAQLDGFGAQCTAFLLDVGESADPAYLLTNGHCVGLFDAITVLTNSPAPDASARFRLFADTPDDVLEVPVVRVVYASMRATDVAIVELDATKAELDEAGVAAYLLGAPPVRGDAVRVVGIPVTGVPSDEHVLRGGDCVAGEMIGLVEWEWRWDLAIDTDCKGIFGGNSGSPVFAAGEPAVVVAIVNTTTIGATEGGSCFLGQPCEIADGSVDERADRTYAMPVAGWASCWRASRFDPEADGCPTEREPIVVVDAPLRAVQTGASWGATIGLLDPSAADDADVAVKAGPIAETDCRSRDGYEQLDEGALPVAYNEPLPEEEGFYVLCAAAVVDGEPSLSGAGYAVMEVDVTPPVGETELSIRRFGEDVAVDPIFAVPERSDFLIKHGPAGDTDCSDEDDYVRYRRIPITIPADELPATFCVIPFDDAGNQGAPETFAID